MADAIEKYLKKYLKEFQKAIKLKLISSKEMKTYSKIWKALNQINLEIIKEEWGNYPTEFS